MTSTFNPFSSKRARAGPASFAERPPPAAGLMMAKNRFIWTANEIEMLTPGRHNHFQTSFTKAESRPRCPAAPARDGGRAQVFRPPSIVLARCNWPRKHKILLQQGSQKQPQYPRDKYFSLLR